MDVSELLSFRSEKSNKSSNQPLKRKYDSSDGENLPAIKKGEIAVNSVVKNEPKTDILDSLEQSAEGEELNDLAVKKMLLQFEKKVSKNQEMRIKYPDAPEKFMDSEVELNAIIHQMHVIATVPELYHILVDLNSIKSLLQLLSHENTDISIAIIDLLQELTDIDALTDSEEGAEVLIEALIEGQVIALLVQNMDRFDESVKEESEGVHSSLNVIENMIELKAETCQAATQQGLMQWLLKRMKAKMPFDGNKLYVSEMISILIQNDENNKQLLGELEGIDALLQQLAIYKRHDPSTTEEIEFMENLFTCLCSALAAVVNRDRFLKGEGLQLMNLMLREKKLSRFGSIKVLNHAMTGPEGFENCQKFIDILGLRSVFPLFMKLPKIPKKLGITNDELFEHVICIVSSLVHNSQGMQRQRLMNKFSENDHEKVDRLVELHFKFLEKVRIVDAKIDKDKYDIKKYGGEIDEEQEDQFYLQRLDAGLFCLQQIDYIMLDICHSGPSTIKDRVVHILSIRGGSVKTIKNVMREYAGNIGNARTQKDQEAEQERILQLVDSF